MRRAALLVSLAGALLAAQALPAAAQNGDDWEVKHDPFDQKVVSRYKGILAKNPHDAGALAKLLSMYRRYRTVEKLEGEYKKALEKKPSDYATLAVLGHLFPLFLEFHGGKGVAVSLGILLGLAPLGMMIAVPIFLLTVGVTRYVSLGSILAAAVTPLVLAALSYPWPTTLLALVTGVGIAVRHRDNIRRIRFGTEARVGGRPSAYPDSGYA